MNVNVKIIFLAQHCVESHFYLIGKMVWIKWSDFDFDFVPHEPLWTACLWYVFCNQHFRISKFIFKYMFYICTTFYVYNEHAYFKTGRHTHTPSDPFNWLDVLVECNWNTRKCHDNRTIVLNHFPRGCINMSETMYTFSLWIRSTIWIEPEYCEYLYE